MKYRAYYLEIEGDTLFIDLMGICGVDFTSKMVLEDIRFTGASKVHFIIDSVGGDVFSAFSIKDYIEVKGIEATCEIYGICASAATVIASACATRLMAPSAFFMIHNSSRWDGGEDETTEKINQRLIAIYESLTGLDPDTLATMMDEETFMTAKEAKDSGFITEELEPMQVAACMKRKLSFNNMSTTKEGNKPEKDNKGFAHVISEGKSYLGMNETDADELSEEAAVVNELIEDSKAKDTAIAEMKEELSEKEGEVDTLKAKLEELEAEKEGVETEKAEIMARVETLQESVDSFKAQVAELEKIPVVAKHLANDVSETVDPETSKEVIEEKPLSKMERVQARLRGDVK